MKLRETELTFADTVEINVQVKAFGRMPLTRAEYQAARAMIVRKGWKTYQITGEERALERGEFDVYGPRKARGGPDTFMVSKLGRFIKVIKVNLGETVSVRYYS